MSCHYNYYSNNHLLLLLLFVIIIALSLKKTLNHNFS